MEKIWSEAFGDNYPKGIDHFGYLTQFDLQVIAEKLSLDPGSTLLDIGCGKGGPGLKLAQQMDLKLTGIDVIPEAIDQANRFKAEWKLAHPAHFEIGQFYQIPLGDQSMDAVISIDTQVYV